MKGFPTASVNDLLCLIVYRRLTNETYIVFIVHYSIIYSQKMPSTSVQNQATNVTASVSFDLISAHNSVRRLLNYELKTHDKDTSRSNCVQTDATLRHYEWNNLS